MLVIGIAGGSGSGKTTVVKELVRQLPENSVSVISQDAYYFDNGDKTPEEKKQINFDHPDAIEWDLLIDHLDRLKNGETIPMPIYTYVTCARSQEVIYVHPTEVIIVEGIMVLTVLRHYQTFVKPMHQQFIEPTKRSADIILPRGSSPVVVDILASRIRMHLGK